MRYNCQWDREPRARKDHRCYECGRVIPKGETYHKQTGIFDGDPYTWKAHKQCAKLYWALNRENFIWADAMTTSDFDMEDIEVFRGIYPHAVTRQQFIRDRTDPDL